MDGAMRKVSKAAQDICARLDAELEEIAGEKVAFSLFIWTGGRCTYVSTAPDRREIINVLEQMIAKWKAGMPDIPAHDVS